MIGYLEGKLLKKEEDRVLLLTNQVGYEVLLPAIVMKPKPVLIGFNLEVEKEFFQYFISVEDIGPLKAVKALEVPVREIATAIESGDVGKLTQLKGIGRRTAQKIIATLEGKMGKFALIRPDEDRGPLLVEDFSKQVLDVMIKELGHKPADARQMIAKAMKRNSAIANAEELFEEVYRGERMEGN